MLTDDTADIDRQAETPTAPPGAVSHFLIAPAALGSVAGVLVIARGKGSLAVAVLLAAIITAGMVTWARTRERPVALVGVVAWSSATAIYTAGLLTYADTRQSSITTGLALAGIAGAGTVAAWILRWRSERDLAQMARLLARPFVESPRSWPMALLGAGVSLPLIGSYGALIGESDSAWLVVSTTDVRENGIGLLERTQEVFLPHLVLSPLLELGGYRAAVGFTVVATIGLVALVAWLVHRLVGSPLASLLASAALMSFPEVVARADRLPMYSVMLILGYLGGVVLHRAMSEARSPWWMAPVGAAGIVGSMEAHSVGQLFLMVPFLLLVLHPWSRARRPFLIAVGTMAVLGLPRVFVNLADGGLTAFRSNYTDFMIQRGYLRTVNRDFWGQNVDASPLEYLSNIPDLVRGAFGEMSFMPVLVLVAFAAALIKGRSRTFVILAAGAYLAALSIASPGTYSRYLLPLSVGAAMVAGIGAARSRQLVGEGRLLSNLLIGLLVAGAITNLGSFVNHEAARKRAIRSGSWPVFASMIDDDKSVLGVRSHELLWTDPDVEAEFARTMAEEDFVTFATWPSDEAVLEVMDRIGAGWIFVHSEWALELAYHNAWLVPAYGLEARHIEQISISDEFCLVAEIDRRRLYRRGGCPGGYLPGPYEPADLDEDGYPDALEARLGVGDPPVILTPEETEDDELSEPGAVDGPEVDVETPTDVEGEATPESDDLSETSTEGDEEDGQP